MPGGGPAGGSGSPNGNCAAATEMNGNCAAATENSRLAAHKRRAESQRGMKSRRRGSRRQLIFCSARVKQSSKTVNG
eukprot:7209685-Prymnesium_polylepis.1